MTSSAMRNGQNLNFAIPASDILLQVVRSELGVPLKRFPLVRTPDVEAYIRRARSAWNEGEYDKALGQYTEALRLDPEHDGAYRGRGQIWLMMRDYDRALQDYHKVVLLDPDRVDAYRGRASAWEGKGDTDNALADLTTAIRLDPNDPESFRRRGWAWREKKEYEKARKDHEEAVRLALDNPHAKALAPMPCRDLAWLLATCPEAKTRDGERAIWAATKACELSGWSWGVYADTLATAYAEAGQFEEAVRYQRKALEDRNLSAATKDEFLKRLELYRQRKPFRDVR